MRLATPGGKNGRVSTTAGASSPLPESKRRRQRERVYRWLAAVHSGPLGMALAGHPELAPRYREAYSRCPGHEGLSCGLAGGVPSTCLPRRFEELAESAKKGGRRRREAEAERLRELLLCTGLLEQSQPPDFAPLWERTREILTRDLAELEGSKAQGGERRRELRP